MASLRARIRNQENENALHPNTHKASRTPGLKGKGGIETPRRALGDVGNIFKTPAANALAKSAQKQTLKSSTSRRNKPLLNVESKKDIRKSSLSQREDSREKEKMFPFVDEDLPLPRSQAVNTILQNVTQLYKGCLHPSGFKPLYQENSAKLDIKLENTERPNSITDPFCWLPEDMLFEPPSEISLDDMEPVDTDLSGLGLP